MTSTLQQILSSDLGHKEQVALITDVVKADETALAQLFELLRSGRDVEKGTAAEEMKFVSKDNPDLMLPYIDLLVEYIDYKAPRVRWGCPEVIGNMAVRYPRQVEKAIPNLLGNLNDKSTVVRWCAAYALTEIAKYHQEKQAELVGVMQKLMETEHNNGVRNLYVKALKKIGEH
jgi:HEAT repeat protein